MKCVYFYSFTVLCLYKLEAKEIPCHYDQSTDLNKERFSSNGSIFKPCLPFCCPPNYIKKEHPNRECVYYKHDVLLNTSNNRRYEEFVVTDEYNMIIGKSCDLPKMYRLEDNVDEWWLFKVFLNL